MFSTQVGPPGSPLKYKIKNNQYSSVEIKLGRLTTKSWLGEDSILLGKPMRYSAIAINKMKVLEITEEFFQKIPKEIKI